MTKWSGPLEKVDEYRWRIPKGGLFEPHVIDHYQNSPNYALEIPDRWFEDFLRVLEQYNFTIDENSTVDADVSVERRRGEQLFGHTRITTQINWCKKYGINNIIFTHLGKETIANENKFSQEHIEATLAYDGMELVL